MRTPSILVLIIFIVLIFILIIRFSKIIPSFFVDKASCTRQFESKLSLHSLASLFPIKEGSTSHLGLLPSGKKRKTALLDAQNRYAIRLADQSKVSPNCAGWDRLNHYLSFYPIVLMKDTPF